MGKVYQSLRGVVQETLQLSKTNSMVFTRVRGSDAASLDAIEELEKILVDSIGRLKAAVGEAQSTAQVIESLRVNIAVLEANLREIEDTVRRKDVASQRMEEDLSTKIRDLESEVKEKVQALESRGSEVNGLKSRLTHLESAIQQAKREAAGEAQRAAESLTGSSKAKIAALEAQLNQAEQIVRRKDWTLTELDQKLTARIHDLESQVSNQKKLLADRDRQVADLNSGLKRLANGIKEKSSFFTQAEALADIQAPDIGTVVADKQWKTWDKKPPTSQFQQDVGVKYKVMDSARETVSREAFDRIIGAFTELTNVMGSMASLIVRDHVKALGESMEKFPKTRLAELLDNLSQEISDENLKTGFRKHLGDL